MLAFQKWMWIRVKGSAEVKSIKPKYINDLDTLIKDFRKYRILDI